MPRTASRVVILPLALLALAIQVVRPARTNPPVDAARTLEARMRVPPDVSAMLRRACQDCHSNETRWPWYSKVAPISWFLVSHVTDGRRHLNFSEWDPVAAQRAGSHFEHICEEVRSGGMPLWSYLLLHADARLSASDVEAICAWTARTQRGAAQVSH